MRDIRWIPLRNIDAREFFRRHVDATTLLSTTEAHMTSEQVALVQSSFKSVVPIASKAADLFYDRLFEIAPAGRDFASRSRSRQPASRIWCDLRALRAGWSCPPVDAGTGSRHRVHLR